MNDQQIRTSFHNELSRRRKRDSSAFIIDELGLHHGRCRADIAVIDGKLIGYEIKSDVDSLRRLKNQISSYNSVFDRVHIIITPRYQKEIESMVPTWWGIISVTEGKRGGIHFEFLRRSNKNPLVSDQAIAQLLWRNEAKAILAKLGFQGKQLRERRGQLYDYLVEKLDSKQLRKIVREYLIKRVNWRCLPPAISYDDLSLPTAKS